MLEFKVVMSWSASIVSFVAWLLHGDLLLAIWILLIGAVLMYGAN